MYGNFAGRDASRGMAKQSFEAGVFWVPEMAVNIAWLTRFLDMLTPIDQPLDKLEDLEPDEM